MQVDFTIRHQDDRVLLECTIPREAAPGDVLTAYLTPETANTLLALLLNAIADLRKKP